MHRPGGRRILLLEFSKLAKLTRQSTGAMNCEANSVDARERRSELRGGMCGGCYDVMGSSEALLTWQGIPSNVLGRTPCQEEPWNLSIARCPAFEA
jgi:hypothetical protein